MRKILCHKLRMNKGGYSADGRYFGIGAPIYQIEWYFETGDAIHCDNWEVRAYTRKEAMQAWRKEFRGTAHAMKNAIGKL